MEKKDSKCSSPSSDSNIPRPTSKFGHGVHQLNQSLFELYKPPGKPNLQILFLHGFQFGDYDNAHISTWESKDEDGSTIMWPQTWLREEFPGAHIFSIAYNCRMKESREYGQVDLFILGENLMADLLEANIGQDRRCPVVLVGHSFGGLVIKKLCLFAGTKGSTGSIKHKKFLANVKGMFFYSTPHRGIKTETVASLFKSKSPLLENVEVLSTSAARLNDDFEKLCKFYEDWRIAGVGEGCATEWESYLRFRVVEEASSRYGDEFLIVPSADHITIVRPQNKKSTTFTALKRLVNGVNQMRKVSGVIHQVHGLPNFSSGLEKRVEDLQHLLKQDKSQGTVLGIVGMGGLGKTTVAKQLFNDISSNYEYTCFVENVKDIPIYALEKEILSQFCCDGASMKEDQRQWPYLEKKKTLIVMDDVSLVDQLKKVPKLDHFGGESHLIITSRDQSVFDGFQDCPLYDVEFLTPDEGKELLCQHIFDAQTIEEDHPLVEWVDKVVEKCGGLPLTLEVIGSYLRPYKNKVRFWMQTFSKLENAESVHGSRNDRVWASLQVSIDDLDDNGREAFIDAATCFHDKYLSQAVAAWSTSNGGVDTLWENLIRRSLVKSVPRRDEYAFPTVWVHEHLRDLAKKISQRHSISEYDVDTFRRSSVHDTIWMDVRGRVGRARFWFDSRGTTRDGRRGPDLNTGVHLNLDEDRAWVQLELFDRMENLKYLYLDDVLPEGLSGNFPQSISLLKWTLAHKYGYPKLPLICWKNMHTLGFLRLSGWEISMDLVEALGTVFKLRSLILKNLKGAFRLGDMGNLKSLVVLRLRNVKLIALPDRLGDLHELEVLDIDELTIPELPKSFGGLRSLKDLWIASCSNLRDLPESFGDLVSLASLRIRECGNLTSLPASFGGLRSLASLEIFNCENLRTLRESLGHLSCLKYLWIHGCSILRDLPESFGDLVSLASLEIFRCGNLTSLPESFGGLRTLASLKIARCENLRSLPESFGDLRSLASLEIIDCVNLRSLPKSLGHLSCLEKLVLKACRKLESLPASFGLLSGLQHLSIDQCDKLKSLSDDFGNLSSLALLRLIGCSSLEELPASFGMLSSLEEFYLHGCETLQRLPDEFGQLKALKKLTIFKAPCLQAPFSLGNLSALPYLELDDWRVLENLPASFGFLSEIKSEGSHASNPKDLKGVVHEGVACDDCDMGPIKGARYVSITNDNFDLCLDCFRKAGNQASYTRISDPPNPDRTEVCIIGFSLLNHPALTNSGWVLVDRRLVDLGLMNSGRIGCFYQRI